MNQKSKDLYALIGQDKNAKQYFETLPDYVREQIESRAQNVNSFE